MPKSPAELESSAAIAQAVHAVKTALAVLEAQKPSQKKPNKTTIERPPARKVKRVKAAAGLTKRSHRGFRGLPPPATFDLDAMPAANLLTEFETASATRLSTSTLAAWRKRPNHPLAWVKIGTRVRYRAGSVRQFIASGQRPQPGRPRKKAPAPAPKPPKRKPKPSGNRHHQDPHGGRRAGAPPHIQAAADGGGSGTGGSS